MTGESIMENMLPKVKTIRVMLQNMGDQQDAVFRMAFKMHNTTNYEMVTPESVEQPDMVLVDTDSEEGMQNWQALKQKYTDIPVVMFSTGEPKERTPYLAKPIKFDTLFPILRSLAQGGHIYEVPEYMPSEDGAEPGSNGVRKTTIRRFNPQRGLLGALKAASQGHQDVAVLHNGKPWLVTGSPGGARIITTVLQTVVNSIDFGMNPAAAAAAPRVHHQWTPDELRVEKGISLDTMRMLQDLGHTVSVKPAMGRTQTIQVRENGELWGYSDPRNPDGRTLGY